MNKKLKLMSTSLLASVALSVAAPAFAQDNVMVGDQNTDVAAWLKSEVAKETAKEEAVKAEVKAAEDAAAIIKEKLAQPVPSTVEGAVNNNDAAIDVRNLEGVGNTVVENGSAKVLDTNEVDTRNFDGVGNTVVENTKTGSKVTVKGDSTTSETASSETAASSDTKKETTSSDKKESAKSDKKSATVAKAASSKAGSAVAPSGKSSSAKVSPAAAAKSGEKTLPKTSAVK
ncbi:LPKTxAVK-anchored surface protein [Streptococcus sp. sy010]|uniref:LPKTxAVK-anchored surface protein n=1 Tax=Streptococcus sp. sy010 TaxID=2600148 RepID=UPI0011B7463B|nr:LPKTxAVK-anchored surface protein [Streptococcus sp. sy010]TWT16219.1 hypothetical protein FRX51_02750 [Streptococcus sp. sy010]